MKLNILIITFFNIFISIFISSNILIIQSFSKLFDPYTFAEISHLQDVRNLLILNHLLLLICLVIIKKRFHSLWRLRILLTTGMIGLGLSLGLGFISLFFWDQIFITFHYLLFPQGNWAFSAESHLIQNFPNRYWINSFILNTIIYLIVSFTPYFVLRLRRRFSDNHS